MRFPNLLSASVIILSLSGCASIPNQTVSVAEEYGFFAAGDTGYISDSKKTGLLPVANAVREYCTGKSCQFGLMPGDNIYNDGAAGDAGDAELFRTRFIEPYGPLSALGDEFRIYAALGNHDWYTSRDGALAQVKFHEQTKPFYMDGLFYSTKPPAMNGDLEVFVVDTEMLLASEMVERFEDGDDGALVATGKTRVGGHKNALPVSEEEKQQLQWFTNALAKSTAKWKIVLAHHPLWQSRSDSKYAQSIKLREMLMPALCKYADAYVAGHQHTLELHTDDCGDRSNAPLVHVVSGAGSKARSVDEAFRKWQLVNYPQVSEKSAMGDVFGFSHFNINGDRLQISMISVAENGSHKVEHKSSFSNR